MVKNHKLKVSSRSKLLSIEFGIIECNKGWFCIGSRYFVLQLQFHVLQKNNNNEKNIFYLHFLSFFGQHRRHVNLESIISTIVLDVVEDCISIRQCIVCIDYEVHIEFDIGTLCDIAAAEVTLQINKKVEIIKLQKDLTQAAIHSPHCKQKMMW